MKRLPLILSCSFICIFLFVLIFNSNFRFDGLQWVGNSWIVSGRFYSQYTIDSDAIVVFLLSTTADQIVFYWDTLSNHPDPVCVKFISEHEYIVTNCFGTVVGGGGGF